MALSETPEATLPKERDQPIEQLLFRPVPPPPPPSPALGPRPSPSSLRNHLGKSATIRSPHRQKQRSMSWGHYSAPTLSLSPPYSPPLSTAILPSGGVPFMPHLHTNQHANAARCVMEQKMQEERQRRARKEREEANLTADALRAILKEERIRMSRIAGELAQLKSMAAASQLESEVIEEGRINNLMRRLDDVQQEKGRIICELEREEEMLTNTLQKKLDQVRMEKAVLEEQIEREQKGHTILQEKLADTQGSKHVGIIEENDDEGQVDDSILPDLAAQAETKLVTSS